MASVTFSIPDEVKGAMKTFSWVNWSELARETFIKNMKKREILEKFEKDFEKSKLTDQDCIRLGRRLKKDMMRRA